MNQNKIGEWMATILFVCITLLIVALTTKAILWLFI